MKFCPKCGSILMPKNNKFICPRCNYKTTEKEEAVMREKIESQKAVDIIEKEIETLPLTEAECPKCRHKKAFFWTIQTRAADEPETRFYKCEKCRHVWREYD
jgi:DNA-directed RNA polymerase subunit M